MQTKANSFWIYLFGRLKETKQLEQLLLILLSDSEASVLDLNFQVFSLSIWLVQYIKEGLVLQCEVLWWLDKASNDGHLSIKWSELDSIRYKIKQYLLQSLFVKIYNDLAWILVNIWKQLIFLWKVDSNLSCFKTQNICYLSNCLN